MTKDLTTLLDKLIHAWLTLKVAETMTSVRIDQNAPHLSLKESQRIEQHAALYYAECAQQLQKAHPVPLQHGITHGGFRVHLGHEPGAPVKIERVQ